MAVVGPRPALWNQYDLLEERDRYGANDVCPGLTGWAQIHGRDELEIKEKARLDGYYVKHMNPVMDIRCILGTVSSVLKSEGVVEGGTGAMSSGRKMDKKKILIMEHWYKEAYTYEALLWECAWWRGDSAIYRGTLWAGSGMVSRETGGIVFFGNWREDAGFIEGTWNE